MKVYLYILFLQIIIEIKSKLNIHIIPHSHQDPGWVFTYEEFYNNQVKLIYNNMLKYLLLSSERTFSICEIVNFERWYKQDLDESKRQIIKDLVKEGRIEFVGAGQVQNDEANPIYQEIIDNMVSGLQFVKSEFNATVKVGWQLDPFGHSFANAYLFSKLGFKYYVMERIDFQDNINRINNHNLEFIWKPLNNKYNDIFTHIIPIHYGVNFYFPFFILSDPFNESLSKNYTVDFIKVINQTRSGFKHDNYLLLLGDDFTYVPTQQIYEKIEMMMNYTKYYTINGEEINMFYSTPSKYFEIITKDKKIYEIEREDDFFPYSDRPYAYWSGYFTSRPYLKGLIRKFSNSYMVFIKLFVELRLHYIDDVPLLTDEFKMIGFLMHHDTITGTSKEYVNNDFIKLMSINFTHSYKETINIINQVFHNFFKIDKIIFNTEIVDQGKNVIYNFKDTIDQSIIIGLYNPGIKGKLLVNLEFTKANNNLEIFDSNDNLIKSDFFCFNLDSFKYENKCILSFTWDFSEKIMIYSFKIVVTTNNIIDILDFPKENIEIIQNIGRFKSVNFNPENLNFKIEYFDNYKIEKYNFTIWHGIYNTHINLFNGQNLSSTRPAESNPDGAYIFTPIEEFPIMGNLNKTRSKIIKGNISTSLILRYDDFCFSIITFYHEPSFIKIDTIFDKTNRGKSQSYAMVIDSDINNEITINDQLRPVIFTDSNGLKMIKRIKNYHKKYPHIYNETVSNNFYPVSSVISMRDNDNKNKKISLFNDRPQSGGVLKKGQIILLLNRKSMNDDWRGMCEPLYEKESFETYFKLTHFMMFGNYIFEKKSINYNYNFIFNYFHNNPFLFNDVSNLKTQFENIPSFLADSILISENIRTQYQIINKNLIIGQYYVFYEDYFNNNHSENVGFVSLRFNNKKIRIKVDNNGISINDNKFKKFLGGNQNYDFKIKENDMIFIYYYLDE